MRDDVQDNATRDAAHEAKGDWIKLCRVEDVPEDGGHYVVIDGRAFAVFRERSDDGESIRVLDDVCPHAGASLSAGHIEEGCIVCPWHAWWFRLKDGACPDSPAIAVKAYDVRIVDGDVLIRVT